MYTKPKQDTAASFRQRLIDEYNQHRDCFNRAPNPYNTCNAREEAGYHLKRPRPWDSFRRHAPNDNCPFWEDVRGLILQAIGSMEPVQAFTGGEAA